MTLFLVIMLCVVLFCSLLYAGAGVLKLFTRTNKVIDSAAGVIKDDATNEVKYICETGHGKTVFKGFDITQKVVSLGAPSLPSSVKYEFYPKLSILPAGYTFATDDYNNVIMIRWENKIHTAEVNIHNRNLDNAFLVASKEVFRSFADAAKAILAERQRQERLMNFVKESPKKNALPVIGEKKEWVEDK